MTNGKDKIHLIALNEKGEIQVIEDPTPERMEAMKNVQQQVRTLFMDSDLSPEEVYISLAFLKDSYQAAVVRALGEFLSKRISDNIGSA